MKDFCRICCQYKEMTKTHLPTQKPYNINTVICATKDQIFNSTLWDGTAINKKPISQGGQISQGGLYLYTLCSNCNSMLGNYYDSEFSMWATTAYIYLQKFNYKNIILGFEFFGHPLRFLKYIISVFISMNGIEFSKKNIELVEFIKNKNQTRLSNRYHFDVMLTDSKKARQFGNCGMFTFNDNSGEIGSEFVFRPFIFKMILGEYKDSLRFGNIDIFSHYKYDDCGNINLPTKIVEINTGLPFDYRSKEQIEKDSKLIIF